MEKKTVQRKVNSLNKSCFFPLKRVFVLIDPWTMVFLCIMEKQSKETELANIKDQKRSVSLAEGNVFE